MSDLVRNPVGRFPYGKVQIICMINAWRGHKMKTNLNKIHCYFNFLLQNKSLKINKKVHKKRQQRRLVYIIHVIFSWAQIGRFWFWNRILRSEIGRIFLGPSFFRSLKDAKSSDKLLPHHNTNICKPKWENASVYTLKSLYCINLTRAFILVVRFSDILNRKWNIFVLELGEYSYGEVVPVPIQAK